MLGDVIMDFKSSTVLDSNEPFSRALNSLLKGEQVIVVKDKSYLGIIDDRHLRFRISDPSTIKCENMCVRSPTISPNSSIFDKINAFLAGHFKGLPVIDEKTHAILGMTMRSDLVKEILDLKLFPKQSLFEAMSKPVYSIDINSTVADAKNKMKEYSAHRLLVTDKGYPRGILSTFDFAAMLMEPKGHRGERIHSELKNPDQQPISDFVRDYLATMDKDASIEDAMRKMVEKSTSHVLVLSDKKPVGVFAAVDLFRMLLEIAKGKIGITISGLEGDAQGHYDEIYQDITKTMEKFSKSFEISNINMHIKKGKSVYNAHLSFNADHERIMVSAEEYGITDTVSRLCNEAYTLLSKQKSMEKKYKRKSSGDGSV